MKTRFVFFCCTLLCSAVCANLNGSDDFNDNSRNTNLWFVVSNNLEETNGRLEYRGPSAGEQQGIWAWTKNRGSFTHSWTAAVEVVNLLDPAAITNAEGMIGLAVVNSSDTDNDVFFILFIAGSDGDPYKAVYCGAETNSVPAAESVEFLDATNLTLSISFNANTETLSASYNNGAGSQTLANFSPTAWGMTLYDTFTVAILGQSTDLSVPPGTLYADNFTAAGPEPIIPSLGGSDDFNDDSMNTNTWTVLSPLLSETNNRVEYTAPGTADDYGMWGWTPNQGYCSENWSVSIDAYNASSPTSHNQNAAFELAVFKDWARSFWIGLAAVDSAGSPVMKIDTGWNIGDLDIETLLPADSNAATLRIAYDAASQNLFSQYDTGSGFQTATNFNIANWGLTASDTLNVWVVGYSDNMLISSGEVYADNFKAVTVPTHAVITNSTPGATGFRLDWIPVSGWGSAVTWTTNLVSTPFSNLTAVLPGTANAYTDTLHAAQQEGFYQVDVRVK